MKKFTYIILLFFSTIAFAQSPTCEGASAICSGSVAPFPNTTGVASFGGPGCLGSAPNPAWFFFQIGQSGDLEFTINQGNNPPNYDNQDVDFIVWGPFSSAPNCTDLFDYSTGATTNNIIDCSYSAAPVENMTIAGATSGQFYMLLVTNFSNNSGFIELNQTNEGQPGAGSTNCDIVCGIDLGPDQLFCSTTVSDYTMTATFNQAPTQSGTPTYSWFLDGVLQGTTTTNQYTATQEGTWSVEVIRPGCSDVATDDIVIQFDAPPVLNPPSALVGCEPFDLTSIIPALVAPENPTDYVIYFYLNILDAFAGNANYIADPANFSPGADVDVYIRVENAGNPSCFDAFQFVHVDVDCATPCSLTLTSATDTDDQAICLGNAIDDIVFNVGGDATDAIISSGSLPAGVTGVYNAGVYTISGTPTGTGSFTATVSTVGCATDLTHDVTINVSATAQATFNAIPAQCSGGSNPLPATSLEGWSGSWSPAFDANNSGNYVFTPDTSVAGQECALPSNAVSVTITPSVQATFNAIPAQCSGGSNPLPATSLEGWSGSWSPAFDANNSGNYVFTPDTSVAGQECALPSNAVSVTITSAAQATFNAIPAQCSGGSNPLPATSLEGWSGSWSPAFDANNSGNYVFTPDTSVAGQECALPSNAVSVTITSAAQATFNAIPAQCSGGSNPLPATSLEGWSGSWSPAFDANNSGNYVFTPDTSVAGQECALPSNAVAVTITPSVQATFNAIPAQCAGGSNPLPATSLEGFTGSWSPAFDANNSGNYVFTPDTSVVGQECALPSDPVAVTITPNVQATFNAIPAQCAGGSNPLPATSLEGFTGVWSPAFDANNSGSYVFTPDTSVAGQECALPSNVVAVTITTNAQATFNAIPAQCAGSSTPLPATSLEGWSGTWSPAFDANNSGSYVFTPDTSVAGQECALPSNPVAVTITPTTQATFNAIPAQCAGGSNPLPATSLEGFTGSWSPVFDANNSGNYVFTPDTSVAGQECALPSNPVAVTITPNVQATFNAIPAQCAGGSNPLPATSLEGWSGTWSPAFDANNSGSYVFTPDTSVAGQECALPSNAVTVTITPNVQATFNAIPTQCAGGSNPLPATSLEGWSGVWSPAFDANNSGSYVFTPDTSVAGQECALPSDPIAITITPNVQATFNAIPAQCAGGVNPLPAISLEGFTGSWSPAFDGNNSGNYVFTPDTSVAGQECALPSDPVAVTITPNVQATFDAIPVQCAGGANPLPITSLEGFTGSWSPAFDANNSGNYIFTPDTSVSGQECALPSDPVAVTISPDAEITLQSDITTTNQQVCQEEGITNIEYILSNGATDVNIIGLPAGISYAVVGDLVTISGSSTDPVGVYNYTITTIGGCSFDQETGSVEITIGVEPTFDPFGSVCEGGSFSFPTVSSEGITGSWSPAFDNTQTTSYTFTPDPNQCAVSTDVTLIIKEKPVLLINNSPITLCDGGSLVLDWSSNVSGTTLTYTSSSNNVVYPSSGDESTLNQVLVLTDPEQVGDITITITPYANGCSGEPIEVSVRITPIPEITSVSVSPNPAVICSGSEVVFTVTSNLGNTTYDWQVINNTGVGVAGGVTSGTISDGELILTLDASDPLVAGTLEIEFTPTRDGCTGNPEVSDVVTVNPIPGEPVGLPSYDICDGYTTAISISSNPMITGTSLVYDVVDYYNVSGYSSGGPVGEPLLITDVLTLNDSNEEGYVVYRVYTTLNDCTGSSRDFIVYVKPNPQPVLTDGAICVDSNNQVYQTYWLTVEGVSGSNYIYTWYDSSDLSTPIAITTDPSLEVSVSGNYYVEVQNQTTNCEGTSNTVSVIETNPATSFTTTVTDAFSDNATVVVNVSSGTGMMLYQIDGGGFQESNIFTGVSAGEHEITVIDSQGCTFLQETVLVIDYPKFFTPNGDGYNDTWNIIGLNQPEAKLYIFDRYGKLLKQISTVGQGWDGTYNGEQLPSTDYWFSLQYFENGVSKEFKAHFSMKR